MRWRRTSAAPDADSATTAARCFSPVRSAYWGGLLLHRLPPHRRHRFIGFHVSFNELRRHQFDRVPESSQLASPVVGAATRLHPNQARLKFGEKLHHLRPLQLLAQARLAARIDAVNLKHQFPQIQADCRIFIMGAPAG